MDYEEKFEKEYYIDYGLIWSKGKNLLGGELELALEIGLRGKIGL